MHAHPRRHSPRFRLIFGGVLALVALLAVTPTSHTRAEAPEAARDVTVVQLSQDAVRRVEADRTRVTLLVEEHGGDPAAVQDRINRRMADALSLADAVVGLEVETGRYSVYRDQTTKPERGNGDAEQWRGRQTLVVTGADAARLLTLVGKLQERGLAVVDMSHFVADETARALTDELLGQALQAARERAAVIGERLGKPTIRFAEVNLRADQGGARPMMMAARAEAAGAAPPAARPGLRDVRVVVDVTIELTP